MSRAGASWHPSACSARRWAQSQSALGKLAARCFYFGELNPDL